MTHLWIRAEEHPREERVGLTPAGAAELLGIGFSVTVEESRQRILPISGFRAAGCAIAPEGSWRGAPPETLIFGLKELSDDGAPLTHRHIMFGHAYKGQPAGRRLLARFAAGGGRLYDLEYLVDDAGLRVAAFGYWAGFAGAAVALKCWGAQRRGDILAPVSAFDRASSLLDELKEEISSLSAERPSVIVIGALGRAGAGAAALCDSLELPVTKWDKAETARDGPFPEILTHDIFLNCILAQPGCPILVPGSAASAERSLSVIGDISCDPDSAFTPIKVNDRATSWEAPARRVRRDPPLDVIAIDNLPSLLPAESSEDFAAQLLPHLKSLDRLDRGVWVRASEMFDKHLPATS